MINLLPVKFRQPETEAENTQLGQQNTTERSDEQFAPRRSWDQLTSTQVTKYFKWLFCFSWFVSIYLHLEYVYNRWCDKSSIFLTSWLVYQYRAVFFRTNQYFFHLMPRKPLPSFFLYSQPWWSGWLRSLTDTRLLLIIPSPMKKQTKQMNKCTENLSALFADLGECLKQYTAVDSDNTTHPPGKNLNTSVLADVGHRAWWITKITSKNMTETTHAEFRNCML